MTGNSHVEGKILPTDKWSRFVSLVIVWIRMKHWLPHIVLGGYGSSPGQNYKHVLRSWGIRNTFYVFLGTWITGNWNSLEGCWIRAVNTKKFLDLLVSDIIFDKLPIIILGSYQRMALSTVYLKFQRLKNWYSKGSQSWRAALPSLLGHHFSIRANLIWVWVGNSTKQENIKWCTWKLTRLVLVVRMQRTFSSIFVSWLS
jgi:hypothetical protein